MDTATARLILAADSTTSADDLRRRFTEKRDRLEAGIVSASTTAEKDEQRNALVLLQEAYAVLSGAPQATPAVAPPTVAPTRSHTGTMVGVLLVLGLVGGGWWWFQQQRSAATRERLLTDIAAVSESTNTAITTALEGRIRAFADSGTQADHARVTVAWGDRSTTVRIARERRSVELSRRLETVDGAVKRLNADVEATRSRLAQSAQPETLTGPRKAYAEARHRLWNDYSDWLRKATDDHPTRVHAAAAKAALAADNLELTSTEISAAEQGMAGWDERSKDERSRRFSVPLLRHCADACGAGDRNVAGWYKTDEPVDAALQMLSERLVALDRPEPTTPETAADFALFAALGGDAAKVATWGDKLRRISDITGRMAPLDDPQAAPGAWLALDKPLSELAALVGERGAPVSGWLSAQRDRRARLDAARGALVVLDDGKAEITVAQARALDVHLDELAKLVAGDDADLTRWRTALDPVAATSRFQRAMAVTEREEHERLLVASARGGNLDAGSRMVVLAMWNEMGTIDPRAPRLAAWATATTTHGPFTAAQVYGEFLANWATRHKDDAIDWNAMMHRGRELMLSGPLVHPVLLNETGWLFEEITPGNDAQRAKELRLAAAKAAEAAAATADPLAADSILITGAGAAQEADDKPLAQRLYEQASELAISNGRPLEGASYMIRASWMTDDEKIKTGLVARAMTLYRHEIQAAQERGDLAQRARGLNGLASCLRPENDPANGSWEKAGAAYAEAANAFAAAKLVKLELGAIESQGDCWSPEHNKGGSWEKAAVFYAKASERAKIAGEALLAANYLAQSALCHSPAKNSAGSWTDTAEIYGKAADLAGEAGSRSYRARYLRDQAHGLLEASTPGAVGHYGKAAELYGAAAALMAETGNLIGESHCLHQQAWCLDPDNNPSGSAERSIALYQKAVEVGEAAGRSDADLAVSYFNLAANIAPKAGSTYSGSWVLAAEAFAKAAIHYEASGATGDAGRALYEQALCLYPGRAPSGGYPQTLALANQALGKLEQPKQRLQLAGVQSLRGDCLQPNNNPNGSWMDAAAAFAESARLYVDLGDRPLAASQLRSQAWCTMPNRNSGGSWSAAEAIYAQAVQLASQPEDRAMRAHCLHQQAICIIGNDVANMTDAARALLRRATNIYREIGQEADAKISEDWLQ